MPERPQSVPQPIWERFNRFGLSLRLEAGALLEEPDELCENMWLVLCGLIRLYQTDRKGNAVTLLSVGAGGLVGHHPELKSRQVAGAEALVGSSLLAFPAALVDSWLTEPGAFGPAFTGWLLEDIGLRLEDTYVRLELEHAPATERVARALLVLDRQALLSRMTRQQIADFANLTVETTVRAISSFLRAGTLASSHFTRLSEAERHALGGLLGNSEPSALPYS